jgi:hypothetical protein
MDYDMHPHARRSPGDGSPDRRWRHGNGLRDGDRGPARDKVWGAGGSRFHRIKRPGDHRHVGYGGDLQRPSMPVFREEEVLQRGGARNDSLREISEAFGCENARPEVCGWGRNDGGGRARSLEAYRERREPELGDDRRDEAARRGVGVGNAGKGSSNPAGAARRSRSGGPRAWGAKAQGSLDGTGQPLEGEAGGCRRRQGRGAHGGSGLGVESAATTADGEGPGEDGTEDPLECGEGGDIACRACGLRTCVCVAQDRELAGEVLPLPSGTSDPGAPAGPYGGSLGEPRGAYPHRSADVDGAGRDAEFAVEGGGRVGSAVLGSGACRSGDDPDTDGGASADLGSHQVLRNRTAHEFFLDGHGVVGGLDAAGPAREQDDGHGDKEVGREYLNKTRWVDLGLSFLRSSSQHLDPTSTRRSFFFPRVFESSRDLLPLSLKLVADYFKLPELYSFVQRGDASTPRAIRAFIRRMTVGKGGRQRKSIVYRIKIVAWVMFVVSELNILFCGGHERSSRERVFAFRSTRMCSQQERMLDSFLERVEKFAGNDPIEGAGDVLTWTRGLQGVFDRLDAQEIYGCKTYAAEDIVFEKLDIPSECCVVEAIDLLWDVFPWVEQPSLLLRENMPKKLPRKRVWADDQNWQKFCEFGVTSGLISEIAFEDIFMLNGAPVFSGAFAVPKKSGAQRFILNLQNDIFDMSRGGAELQDPRLPYMSQMTLLEIGEGEAIIAGGEDERASFFMYRLPPCWKRYFAIGKPFKNHVGNEVYPCLCGIPMGFIASVGILQKIQRIFCKQAGYSDSQELRARSPVPDIRKAPIFSVYVDNFNEFRAVEISEVDFEKRCLKFESKIAFQSPEHRRLVEVKVGAGVQLNKDESFSGQTTFDILGAHFDGTSIGLSVAKRRLLSLAGACLLQSPRISYEELASVIGIFSHSFMFRRPLFSIFAKTYSLLQNFKGGTWLPATVVNELRSALCLVLFAECNLRNPIDDYAFVSDASLSGGAFGKSVHPFQPPPRELFRHADVRGTAVRFSPTSSGVGSLPLVAAPGSGQHAHIDLTGVDFQVLKSFPLTYQHITLQEAICFSISVRYHSFRQANRRFVHFFDSQACIGLFAKGRSSAKRLNRLCRRVAACTVAADLQFVYLWVHTKCMPMDEASRQFEPMRIRSNLLAKTKNHSSGSCDLHNSQLREL